MWGKVLAGVAVGVGAVAAAPFTGGGSLLGGASLLGSLAGAGTVAAATGAGLTGAAVGGALAASEEDKNEKIREEGVAKGKATASAELKEFEKALAAAASALETHNELFNAIIALEAVGVACAACDGDFSENEKAEIGEFVKGMMAQKIPKHVKDKIQDIYENPPSIETAFELAKNSGIELEMYEEIIQFVVSVDGEKEEERAFIAAWQQMKAA